MKPESLTEHTTSAAAKTAADGAPRASVATELEIKAAQALLDAAWAELEQECGRENLRFPKEIFLLGGAPGAGKGTHAKFVQDVRGYTSQPIVMSTLLDSPGARAIKASGGMVGDREVIGLLLRELIKPEYAEGVILDGFPRTQVQVECWKMLVEKASRLCDEFSTTPLAAQFRKPVIRILVLFIDEAISVDRQLQRGREILAHNAEVRRTGKGELLEERPTDFDVPLTHRRYNVFKEQTWAALQSLKDNFDYHLVSSDGEIDEVDQRILASLNSR